MDVLSHLLWTNLLYRKRLDHDEAIYLALLPDAAFLLIMGYVIFGKPMAQGWDEAMRTIPWFFISFYHLMHSFVLFGIVGALVWRYKKSLMPAMGAWLLHICMDIPFHAGEFATKFLYPLVPSASLDGIPWTDYRAMALVYLVLVCAYAYAEWRDSRKHRRRNSWTPDLLDRAAALIGGLINPKPVPAGYAQVGDFAGAPVEVPGEDRGGPGEGQDSGPPEVAPPQAG